MSYRRPIQEWSRFCDEYHKDIFEPRVEDVLEFLSLKFEVGASYATMNAYRSAISLICGDRIGKDPTISRLMKGVFKLKPPRPRYEEVYDLGPILTRIEDMFLLSSLSLPELTEKLVVLLALITVHRKQTLSLIKITNIKEFDGGFRIRIPDAIKTSRRGVYQPLLEIPDFKEKPKLCVAATLKRYLHVTDKLRQGTEELFISTRRPYRAASKDTISRWIRAFLVKCGIGNKFVPHSLRHASSSAALKKGVDFNIIKSLAGWSANSRVFDLFYNRPIIKDRRILAESVLS